MSEERFLKGYDPRDYPPVAVTVDVVALTIRDDRLHVLLIQRGEPPYEGFWALPGGFVRPDEDLAAAARREFAEETGLGGDRCGGCTSSSSAATATPAATRGCASSRVALPRVRARPARPAGGLATPATRRGCRSPSCPPASSRSTTAISSTVWSGPGPSSSTRPLATAFVGEEFTIAELRAVYETVWGAPCMPATSTARCCRSPVSWRAPARPPSTAASGRSPGPPLPRRRRAAAAPGAAASGP